MKKLLYVFICLSFFATNIAKGVVLQSGVSVERIPKGFYGNWQVEAQLEKTSNYSRFKTRSADLWNLSRVGDVITLENPFTHAKAQIKVTQIEDNVIVFTKTSTSDNRVLKDIVTIRLNGDTFKGYNDIIYETRSLYDGHVLHTDKAKYLIKGKRISGASILK